MANVRKRISELTALESASLDTTIVGVDGGTTYKIELDTLADAVTSRVNILDRDRLSSLESVTSSFETKGRSVISSSVQITALGFVSESVDISSLNSFTQSFSSSQNILNTAFTNGINARLQTSSFNDFSTSVDSRIIAATNEQSFNGLVSGSSQFTASYDERYVLSGSITQTNWDNIANKPSGIVSQSTDLSSLNNFTASYFTDSSSFDTKITTEKNRIDAILSASNANSDTFAEVVSLINSVDLTNDNAFATFYTSSNNRITSLENSTGSYLTSLSGAISSSSQLTSSFDERYALSASFVSSSNVSSIQTITSASYAALTPVSGTLYIIIG